LDPQEAGYIKNHLAACPQCRGLEEELLRQHKLFQAAGRRQVPEAVWQNIRDAVVTERLEQGNGILGWLKNYFFAPRPIFALASAVTVVIFSLLITGIFIHKKQASSIINGEEIMAGFSVNAQDGDLLYDLGTNIEEYFL